MLNAVVNPAMVESTPQAAYADRLVQVYVGYWGDISLRYLLSFRDTPTAGGYG